MDAKEILERRKALEQTITQAVNDFLTAVDDEVGVRDIRMLKLAAKTPNEDDVFIGVKVDIEI